MNEEVREAMGRVYALRRDLVDGTTRVTAPSDCLPLLEKYTHKTQEHFVVVVLNGAHQIIGHRVASKGLVNRCVVHPREVFRYAIQKNGTAIILAHNHPSGNVEPGQDDIEVTERLAKAGIVVGIPVLDHIVVGKGGHYSFLEHDRL